MYNILEQAFPILLALFVAMTFPGLFGTLGAILGIALGVGALAYVVGPHALLPGLAAVILVDRGAPYCARWFKQWRGERLEAIARADAAKKAAERDAYRAETLEKLRPLGFTWVDGWGPPNGSLQRQIKRDAAPNSATRKADDAAPAEKHLGVALAIAGALIAIGCVAASH